MNDNVRAECWSKALRDVLRKLDGLQAADTEPRRLMQKIADHINVKEGRQVAKAVSPTDN